VNTAESSILATTARTLAAAGCVWSADEAAVLVNAAASPAELAAMVERRAAGAPLELVVGWVDFCGVRITLADGVFVPRLRSEFIVAVAGRLMPDGGVVVDMCCGSGAIGVALATRATGVRLHAVDVDDAAVACARRNVAAVGGRAYCGDLYDALPRDLAGGVDLVVANAPYVPTEEIAYLPAEARRYEPAHALDGGGDGTQTQRRVIEGAREWLRPGGSLAVETSRRQAGLTAAHVVAAGFETTTEESDDYEVSVVVGRASDVRA
jgi:release factor glutamine methyltransferase